MVASTAAAASLHLTGDRPVAPVPPATQPPAGQPQDAGGPTPSRISTVGARDGLPREAGAAPSVSPAPQQAPSTAPEPVGAGAAADADASAGRPAATSDGASGSDEPTRGSSEESPPATDDGNGDQREGSEDEDAGLLPIIPDPGPQPQG